MFNMTCYNFASYIHAFENQENGLKIKTCVGFLCLLFLVGKELTFSFLSPQEIFGWDIPNFLCSHEINKTTFSSLFYFEHEN